MSSSFSNLKKLLNERKFVETYGTSKLESQFQVDVLEPLKVKYIPQFKLAGKYFDFFIPHIKLLIEIDGDYWHGNLKLNLNETQRKAKLNDISKNNIADKLGYNIIRFGEKQIKNSIHTVIHILNQKIQEIETQSPKK